MLLIVIRVPGIHSLQYWKYWYTFISNGNHTFSSEKEGYFHNIPFDQCTVLKGLKFHIITPPSLQSYHRIVWKKVFLCKLLRALFEGFDNLHWKQIITMSKWLHFCLRILKTKKIHFAHQRQYSLIMTAAKLLEICLHLTNVFYRELSR